MNRLFTNALARKVPYTLQDKQKRALQIDHLCWFKQACIIHILKETKVKSAKFNTHGQKGYIVSYIRTTIYKV